MNKIYISPITDKVALEAMTVLQATVPDENAEKPGNNPPEPSAPGRKLYV